MWSKQECNSNEAIKSLYVLIKKWQYNVVVIFIKQLPNQTVISWLCLWSFPITRIKVYFRHFLLETTLKNALFVAIYSQKLPFANRYVCVSRCVLNFRQNFQIKLHRKIHCRKYFARNGLIYLKMFDDAFLLLFFIINFDFHICLFRWA